uniref:REST corepressor n=1 Tax=Romanomermis culicivorax TaxID=13658 RepID=A0A915JMP5_ROMCU
MSASPSTSSNPKCAEKKTNSEKNKDLQVDIFLNDFTETGSVRVGKDYQASIPEFIGDQKVCSDDDKSVLLWSPPENLSETQYYEYTTIAGKEYKYSLEQALGFLQWHEHDVKRALKELAQYVPVSGEWSVEDILVFEQAFAEDDDVETGSESSHKRRKVASNAMKNCKHCGASSSQLYFSPSGKLCNTCFVHFRRTGALREAPSKKRISHELVEESDSDSDNQRNHRAPRNMSLNVNDFIQTSEKSSQKNSNIRQRNSLSKDYSASSSMAYDFSKHVDNEKMIREIISLRDQAAKNRFNISQMKKCLLGTTDINSCRLSPKSRPSKTLFKWSQHEIYLVLQGFRMFGKNFQNISNLMGTKTVDQIRTFYATHRSKYNIDSLINELEKQKVDEKRAKDETVIVLSDEERGDASNEIFLIDDEDDE